MRESTLLKHVMLALSEAGATVFRQNVGQAWAGKVTRIVPDSVRIDGARPLHAGLCVGSSDIIGWTADGRFLAIEVKTKNGRASKEQVQFIESVRRSGGVAGVARSVEDAIKILEGRSEP